MTVPMLNRLVAILDETPPAEVVPTALGLLKEWLEADGLEYHVVDLSERRLVPISSIGGEPTPLGESVLKEVVFERAIRRHAGRLLVPTLVRGRSNGVLVVHTDSQLDDDELLRIGVIVGTAVFVVSRHSDVIERQRGANELRLAATMQRDLLPFPDYIDSQFELSGYIEPAYDIAGDAYDYAANGTVVEFAIFDAVGHGLRAAMLSAVAVSAYRFARRRYEELAEVHESINAAIAGQGDGVDFVTGLVCRVDAAEGRFEVVSAGHYPPILVRPGLPPADLGVSPTPPFGLSDRSAEVVAVDVEPGDSLFGYSDGILEASNMDGHRFGMEPLRSQLERDEPLRFITREVMQGVIAHVGQDLSDDATLVGCRLL